MMKIAVFGGGAWGTALANLWADTPDGATLWARDAETVTAINETRENPRRLPGHALSEHLRATTALKEGFAEAEIAVLAVPAQFLGAFAQKAKPHVPAGIPLVLCAKGIEQSTGRFPSEIVSDAWPGHTVMALSGPSFAADLARGLPTAVTFAGEDTEVLQQWHPVLARHHFRLYTTDDLTGVEIGGALKNVFAIACGISDGLGLGASARAALIARGFAELRRFADAHDARTDTLIGLSGLGDLVLTCSSRQSRNMSLGLAIGSGKTVDEALEASRGVTEGAATAPIVVKMAKKKAIDIPIMETVMHVLAGDLSARDAITRLLSRPLRSEN